MESPAVLGVLFCFYFFYDLIGMPQTLMCLIWLSHYLHRTLIWPLRAELHGRKMPLKIALLAFVFNTINIIIQCLWIFFLGNYLEEWITSGFFMLGCFIFYIGMYVNIYSDNILMNLRKTKGNGYHIPEGFLFKYVSCPNYLGEIGVWFGIYFMGISSGLAPLWIILCPLSMLTLFVFASCPMMDNRSLEKRPDYEEYMKNTPALIPNFFNK